MPIRTATRGACAQRDAVRLRLLEGFGQQHLDPAWAMAMADRGGWCRVFVRHRPGIGGVDAVHTEQISQYSAPSAAVRTTAVVSEPRPAVTSPVRLTP